MEQVKGFKILDTVVHDGKNTTIRRGVKLEDETPVIVKLLKAEYPTAREIAKFRQEYEITRRLDNSGGIIRSLALEGYRNGLALVLEDFGGTAIPSAFTSIKLELNHFLKVAVSVAEILGNIHKNDVIHKDIKPQNILYNPQTQEVKIIDFGISTLLSRESQNAVAATNLEGSLPYISPEQTGRMNRSIDYRTDFYSLGVAFYEMLTGRLPFDSKDPMELLHCHIAVQPPAPHDVDSSVPVMLSRIVMKLMAKNAEDRYQSAFGLKSDLEECARRFQAAGAIEPFELGGRDASERFQIPQKLYGRDKEVKTLMKTFARASLGNSELMMVSGYSGIGKSALVNEVQKPLVETRGYFIAGKFDQFKRNIPYSAPIQAIQSLVREILTESDESIQVWKTQLLEAFGTNGQVIVDVIPEVELIVGKQPPVPELGPAESQNRLMYLFQSFIRVLAQKDHPLAIFLDDLQWADSATLNLIQNLMQDRESKYLLIIGAYRDNEVDRHHPMMVMLSDLKKGGATIKNIKLGPLEAEDVNSLISDTFNCEPDLSRPLTDLVVTKTNGNPFFVNEFLKSLADEKKVSFSHDTGGWQWDINDIRQMNLSDNVVELMADKIQKLAPEVQEILRMGACIGNVFNLKTLSVVTETPIEKAAETAMTAIKEGLILPLGDAYKLVSSAEKGEKQTEQFESVNYKFLHDRVQQASYSLLSDEDRVEAHHKIGTLLLQTTPADHLEEKIFDIVSQLNEGSPLIKDDEERFRLAELNLKAGHKAKASSAFAPALEHFTHAVELLPENIWEANYDIAYELFRERSQTEYLVGNTEKAEELFDLVIKKARTRLEKASVYRIKQILLFDQNKYRESILVGLEGLRMFGIKLPEKPSQVRVLSELAKIPINLGRRKIKDLIDEPELKDPEKIAVLGIIQELLPCGYLTNPDLLVLGALRMANISLKYGNSALSAYAYGVTGLVLNGALFLYKIGNEFNLLSLKLLDRFADYPATGPSIGPTYMLSASFTTWPIERMNGSEIEERRKIAVQKSIDYGVFNYTTYTLTLSFASRFLKGDSLSSVHDYLKQYEQFIAGAKDDDAEKLYVLELQFLNNLQGKTQGKYSMTDMEGRFNADDYIREAKSRAYNTGIFFFFALSSIINYTYEDYEGALKAGIEASKKWEGALSNAALTLQAFYQALAAIALVGSPNIKGSKSKYWKAFKKNKGHIKGKWFKHNPVNFSQLLWLLEAEEARVKGDQLTAMEKYEAAIRHSREHNFTNYLALANELAGKFYESVGKTKIARSYMAEAHYVYNMWGADAKVKDLEEKYPDLLTRAGVEGTGSTTSAFVVTTTTGDTTMDTADAGSSTGGMLDLGTVMKASQAISGEIKLDKLLSQLMEIVIENAGAQRGFMLLNRNGKWLIEAEGEVGEKERAVLQSISAEESGRLSMGVTKYVARVREDVVLNDAANEGNFVNDDYIKRHGVKSLLCSPILHQGNHIGTMYLENNLTTGAFTPDRLRVLKLLSSQAAISLENASLYANLEEKVEERTAELRESKKEIDDIMANVQQGLLTVNRDGTISSEYSSRVAEIFERDDLGEKKFEDMYIHDPDTKGKVADFLDQMLNNPFMSEKLFARANPLANYSYTMVNAARKEVVKVLDFNFSRIYGTDEEGNRTKDIQKIMVVIDDRTEEFELKRELEQKAQEQASKVEKLYQILQLPPNVFSGFISESSVTLDTVYQNLNKLRVGENSPDNLKLLQVCYREVHTLKGNARALNLDSIGKTAHELEDVFDELKEKPTELTQELKDKVFDAVASLKNDIQDGNSLFEKILNMQSALQTKSQDAMGEFEERFRNIVDKEAQELGKAVSFEFRNELSKPLEGPIMIKLRNPLSHIIRNSMSHGIEPDEERAKLGKEPGGRITVALSEKDGHLLIACEDDGSGLKTDKIKEKAIEQKLISAEKAANMSESEIHKLIFASGLSTADKVSDIAGRGVGMDAVREDLKALNSVIMVASKPGQYTRFTIKIPMP